MVSGRLDLTLKNWPHETRDHAMVITGVLGSGFCKGLGTFLCVLGDGEG